MHYESEVLEELAQPLIANFHPELATAKIKYMFKDADFKEKGQLRFGKVTKVNDLYKVLTGLDFIVEIGEPAWRDLTLAHQQAAMDSLLERITSEETDGGDLKYSLRDPDVKEFSSILERHGVWNKGLEQLVQVAKAIDTDGLIQEVNETELSVED